jgi:hypothetical protein
MAVGCARSPGLQASQHTTPSILIGHSKNPPKNQKCRKWSIFPTFLPKFQPCDRTQWRGCMAPCTVEEAQDSKLLGLQASWDSKNPGTCGIPGLEESRDSKLLGLEQSWDLRNPGTPDSRGSNNPGITGIPGWEESGDFRNPGTPGIPGLQESRDSRNPGTPGMNFPGTRIIVGL